MAVAVAVRNRGPQQTATYTVETQLYDENDEPVWPAPLTTQVAIGSVQPGQDATARGSKAVAGPKLWSAEHPHLYTAVLRLRDPSGAVTQTVSARVGFRDFAIRDGLMRINGKPVSLRGTNRHEMDPDHGAALTRDDMVRDIAVMKRLNINAMRTSHYPNHPDWYDLADEYGMYVMDEANLETHGIRDNYPASNSAWTAPVIDRATQMVHRDKNHPSVVMWSLGNEAGGGSNFVAMRDWIRSADPTRIIQYEGDNRPAVSDIRSQMYNSAAGIRDRALDTGDTRPYILVEYSHGMGNSNGNLKEYWDVIRQYPILQGGYLWDFADQALRWPIPLGGGATYLAYGGDWGDNPNDGNFCGNGIVLADRTETGKSAEVKRVYQAINAAAGSNLAAGDVRVTNEFAFANVNEFAGSWALVADGEVIQSGDLTAQQLDIAPLSDKVIQVPIQRPATIAPGTEHFLELSFTLKSATAWADEGHEVAAQQLPVDFDSPPVEPVPIADVPTLTDAETTDRITVTGDDFAVTISKTTGEITAYEAMGMRLVNSGPVPNFWRAPTDNDRGNGHPTRNGTWRAAGRNRTVTGVAVARPSDRSRRIAVTGTLPTSTQSSFTLTYTVYGNGEIKVDSTLHPGSSSLPYIPEVGTILVLPGALEQMRYYGRGPDENHWDRHTGTDIGQYDSTVSDQWTPYLRPQENGNKTDVRWVALVDGSGRGLLASGDSLLEVNASHYTPEDLSGGTRHDYQLTPRQEVVLRLNHRQTGVGGDNSWGAHPLDQYKLFPNRDYSFTYRLKPLPDIDEAMALSRRPTETGGGSGGPVEPGVFYRLVAQHSGKAADISGASTSAGAALVQWSANSGTNQQFDFVDAGSGYWRIRARHCGLVLQVAGTGTGADITQQPDFHCDQPAMAGRRPRRRHDRPGQPRQRPGHGRLERLHRRRRPHLPMEFLRRRQPALQPPTHLTRRPARRRRRAGRIRCNGPQRRSVSSGSVTSAPVMAATRSSVVASAARNRAVRRPSRMTSTRSAISRTCGMLWLTSTTDMPASRARSMTSSTRRVWTTPSAAVGSSRITKLVAHTTARATATLCRCPPESMAIGVVTRGTRTPSCPKASAAPRRIAPLSSRPIRPARPRRRISRPR